MKHLSRRLSLPVLLIAIVTAVGVGIPATSQAAGTTPVTGRRMNWPCAGCITYIPPTYNAAKPSKVLVALHGDEGTPTTIESVWESIAKQNNAILFAPLCPTNLGCQFDNGAGGVTNSWWGWFQYSPKYNDYWVGLELNAIGKSYTLDTKNEYLTGWSGGADYLGWFAPTHTRFAAAAFVVGGVPYSQSCPVNKQAAYFLMGSNDFRYQSGQPSQVKGVYDSCGDTTKLVVLPGADHQGTINALTSQGYASKIMAWLLLHPKP